MSKQNKPQISTDQIRQAIVKEASKGREAPSGTTPSGSPEGLDRRRREPKPRSSLKHAAKDSLKNMIKCSFRIPIIGHVTKACAGFTRMPAKFNYLLEQVEMLSDRILVLERSLRNGYEAVSMVRRQPLLLGECGNIIEAAQAGTKGDPVLDIGCGKGEWLAYLKERGYVARGIDGNGGYVQECSRRNLDVEEGLLSEYLRRQSENAFGAVTYFHPVESMKLGSLLELIDQSRRIMRAGGVLILEMVGEGHPEQKSSLVSLLGEKGFNKAEVVQMRPTPGSGFEAAYLLIGYKA